MFRAFIDQLLLTWRLLRDPRVPLWSKIIPFLPLVYIISPLDFIPDVIIGLGQLDDLGLLIAGLRLFESSVPQYLVDEHREALVRRQQPIEVVDAPGYSVKREQTEPDDGRTDS